MAQTGYTPIQLYRSATPATAPSASNLADGELAINTTDEALYFKNASGTVKLIAASVTPVTNGGTGASSASSARSNLGVPSTTGSGASGTWGIDISGNAATATSATTATSASSATTATTATTANALNTGNSYKGATFTGSIGSPSLGQFMGVGGSGSTWYNTIWRNDGSNFYLLSSNAVSTQAAAETASWNSYRPFAWNLSNGAVTIDGTGSGANFGGSITASGNVTGYSDAKLKTNLTRIDGALDKVEALTGYCYTRIDTGARQTGLIAQDVQQVLPEAVEDVDGTLALAYGNLAGLIVEAIKELRAEVAELRQQAVKVVTK